MKILLLVLILAGCATPANMDPSKSVEVAHLMFCSDINGEKCYSFWPNLSADRCEDLRIKYQKELPEASNGHFTCEITDHYICEAWSDDVVY